MADLAKQMEWNLPLDVPSRLNHALPYGLEAGIIKGQGRFDAGTSTELRYCATFISCESYNRMIKALRPYSRSWT